MAMSKFRRGDEVRWKVGNRRPGTVAGYRFPLPGSPETEHQVIVDLAYGGITCTHEDNLALVCKPPSIVNPFVAFNERGLVLGRADRVDEAIRLTNRREGLFVLDENTGTWYDSNGEALP